jgi:hypothetical protein
VIGDSEAPTRTGTPALGKPTPANPSSSGKDDGATAEDKEKGTEESGETKQPAVVELPPDIQQRLKKLDRLEPKYAGTSIVKASLTSN